jgi:hypothetical protein
MSVSEPDGPEETAVWWREYHRLRQITGRNLNAQGRDSAVALVADGLLLAWRRDRDNLLTNLGETFYGSNTAA